MSNQVLIERKRSMSQSQGLRCKINRGTPIILCIALQIFLLLPQLLSLFIELIIYLFTWCFSENERYKFICSIWLLNFIEIFQYVDGNPPQLPPIPRRGLKNLGNTCYINSSLRCILQMKTLIEILNERKTQKNNVQKKLLKALLQLNIQIRKVGSADFAPRDIKSIVQQTNSSFKGTNQQDAGQWMLNFFNILSEELNTVQKPIKHQIDKKLTKNESKIKQLFQQSIKREKGLSFSVLDEIIYGHSKTEYQCLTCNQKEFSFQKFFCVQLSIPKKSEKQALWNCWDQFSQPEITTEQNKLFCNHCNSDQKMKKIMTVFILNEYLLINMNRGATGTQKNNKLVEVPFIFQPKLSSNQSCKYQLIAMINHQGTTKGGHYRATGREEQTSQWFQYSDTRSWKLAEDKALQNAKKASYLVYRKNK